jgi:hypothetical protein
MATIQTSMLWHAGGADGEMDDATRAKVEAYVTAHVGDFRCPDHQQPITVVCSGTKLEELNFEVKGCCQKAIYLARKKLSE